jgi:hypothetical protein
MKIAVTDANIFIDLIKLQILELLFCIGLEIHTTQEIIDQLNESQLNKLNIHIGKAAIRVHKFDAEELENIVLFETPRALELADKSIVWLAIKLSAVVLSGDNPVRKFCELKNLPVKGILWLFDEFVEKSLLAETDAHRKMEYLISFNNRLPKEQCLYDCEN